MPPLWPWIELLRELLRTSLAAELIDEVLLAAFAPWLPSQFRKRVRTIDSAPVSWFALLDRLVQLVLEVGRRGPLMLVVEDLHDYDAASLAVVQELVRRLRDERVLMLVTCRTAESFSGAEELTRIAARLEHECALEGLSASEVRELLEDGLASRVPESLAERVHRRSGGIPLYVRAVRSVLGSADASGLGRVDIARLRLPETLRRAGSDQLAGVSARCREFLRVLPVGMRGHGVTGERFT